MNKFIFPYKTRQEFRQILVDLPDGRYAGEEFTIIENPDISFEDSKLLKPIFFLKPFVKLKEIYGIYFPKQWLNYELNETLYQQNR